jgi:hypothetical protein
MDESRFPCVIFLRDPQDSDQGGIMEDLAQVLAESHPNIKFLHPPVPAGSTAFSGFNLMVTKLLPLFQPSSLVIGNGLGGLFAITMQERFPYLDLSVFAINPPSKRDELKVGAWRPKRVILYSSEYEPIRADSPKIWAEYVDSAFDVPWLSGGVQRALYATSYLISAFMRGSNMRREVASFMPKAQSEAAGI